MKHRIIEFALILISILLFFVNEAFCEDLKLKESIAFLSVERTEFRYHHSNTTIIEIRNNTMTVMYSGYFGKSNKDIKRVFDKKDLTFSQYDRLLVRMMNYLEVLKIPSSLGNANLTKPTNLYIFCYKNNKGKKIEKRIYVYNFNEAISEKSDSNLYKIYLFDIFIDKLLYKVFEERLWE